MIIIILLTFSFLRYIGIKKTLMYINFIAIYFTVLNNEIYVHCLRQFIEFEASKGRKLIFFNKAYIHAQCIVI